MKKYEMGRNIFNEKCVAKSAKIYKETAKEQYITIIRDIRRTRLSSGLPCEYDVEFIGFTESELYEFHQWMDTVASNSPLLYIF